MAEGSLVLLETPESHKLVLVEPVKGDIKATNVMADSFPSLKELYEYMIPDHAVKWRTVGEMLGLPTGELDIIENDNHYKAVPCCQAMLRKWLDIYPNATMRKLCDAVRSPVVVALNNDNSNITSTGITSVQEKSAGVTPLKDISNNKLQRNKPDLVKGNKRSRNQSVPFTYWDHDLFKKVKKRSSTWIAPLPKRKKKHSPQKLCEFGFTSRKKRNMKSKNSNG
ncbi:uncharacterized protein [Dysidea avara]|uniref:uncharacterized protein n=1 Tax=Dysidea avara TaxID=196820 RepID=UPI00331F1825